MKKLEVFLFCILGILALSFVYTIFIYIPSLKEENRFFKEAKERKIKNPIIFVGERASGRIWVYRCSDCKEEDSKLYRISQVWMETHDMIVVLSSKKQLSKKEKNDLNLLKYKEDKLALLKKEMQEEIKYFINSE